MKEVHFKAFGHNWTWMPQVFLRTMAELLLEAAFCIGFGYMMAAALWGLLTGTPFF